MEYNVQLGFVRKFLQNLNVSSSIWEDPNHLISPEVDMGLRELLFGKENYLTLTDSSANMIEERTIYRYFDEYGCHYILMRLPNAQMLTCFSIGPYLMSIPSEEMLLQIGMRLSLSDSQLHQLKIFYAELPIIEDENVLLSLANTLGITLWGDSSKFTLEYLNYAIVDQATPAPVVMPISDPYNTPRSLSVLEKGYEGERLLMEAVSKGKLNQVSEVATQLFGTEPRMADSLRESKNNLIILKTLLRKAAEYGGVHPLHIHRISSRHAADIENARTIRKCLRLQEEMIRDYCLLVKQHSLSKYSYHVGQAITLVQYDLTADLRLKSIADQLNVTPSYLSAMFHREYGCTLTAFINKQRIDNAVALLQTTQKPIQEIAMECGIHDVNYFIKLFKKHIGLTPNRYREQLGGKQ